MYTHHHHHHSTRTQNLINIFWYFIYTQIQQTIEYNASLGKWQSSKNAQRQTYISSSTSLSLGILLLLSWLRCVAHSSHSWLCVAFVCTIFRIHSAIKIISFIIVIMIAYSIVYSTNPTRTDRDRDGDVVGRGGGEREMWWKGNTEKKKKNSTTETTMRTANCWTVFVICCCCRWSEQRLAKYCIIIIITSKNNSVTTTIIIMNIEHVWNANRVPIKQNAMRWY